jgi:hypothetical protein
MDAACGSWLVWRQDDHGHRFVVGVVSDQADALRLVRELESRGHKQTYWAAPAEAPRSRQT